MFTLIFIHDFRVPTESITITTWRTWLRQAKIRRIDWCNKNEDKLLCIKDNFIVNSEESFGEINTWAHLLLFFLFNIRAQCSTRSQHFWNIPFSTTNNGMNKISSINNIFKISKPISCAFMALLTSRLLLFCGSARY